MPRHLEQACFLFSPFRLARISQFTCTYHLPLAHGSRPSLSASVTKMVLLSPTSRRMLTRRTLTAGWALVEGMYGFCISILIVDFDLQVPAETAGTLATGNCRQQTLLLQVIFSMMLDTTSLSCIVSPATGPRVPGSVCIRD